MESLIAWFADLEFSDWLVIAMIASIVGTLAILIGTEIAERRQRRRDDERDDRDR